VGFNEKLYWSIIILTIIVAAWYADAAIAFAANSTTAIEDFSAYLWWAMGIYVVAIIVGTILVAIFDKDKNKETYDERDNIIDMRSERIASYAQGFGLFGILVMVMMDYSAFALANSILGVMVFSTLVGFGLRLFHYRRRA